MRATTTTVDCDLDEGRYIDVKNMYAKLSGNTSATFDTISTMADNIANASDFRAKNNGRDIVIRYKDFYWYPMYLSRSKNNQVVLTLWLSNIIDQNFAYRTTWYGLGDYGNRDFYLFSILQRNISFSEEEIKSSVSIKCFTQNGYAKGYMYTPIDTGAHGWKYGLSSDNYSWSDNLYSLWDTDAAQTVCCRTFDSSGNMVIGDTSDMNGYIPGLYYVKPSEMAWQEVQSAKEILGMPYNLPNETYLKKISDDGFYSPDNNYSRFAMNPTWADQSHWLPSLSEIGYEGVSGLWGASSAQRACYDTELHKVGYNGHNSYPTTWTRSGNYKQSYGYYFIKSNGDGKGVGTVGARVFRPCMHLSLTTLDSKFAH